MKYYNTNKLKDIVDINPAESLKKGTVAKKIGMDILQPYTRSIPSYTFEPFSGGTKFRNGDTIMARITPCLENGKTAMVSILDKDEIGFGSTEYIVFRAKEGITDPFFIYYLVTSSEIREPAIKSMVGSSGRQRVQTDVIANLTIKLPPLPIQQKIAAILSSLDDKIELNNKINENLEQQAQAFFNEMFSEHITQLSENDSKTLKELVDVIDNRGKTPPLEKEETYFPIIDVGTLNSYGRIIDYSNCTKFVSEQTYNTFFRSGHPKENDILLSSVGCNLALLKYYIGDKGCIAQNVVAFRSKGISSYYLYQYLKYIQKDLISYDIGSAQPSIKVTHIIKHQIYIPSDEELNSFNKFSRSITEQIYNNVCENERLISIRDTLLPKLMSGEIDVDSVEI